MINCNLFHLFSPESLYNYLHFSKLHNKKSLARTQLTGRDPKERIKELILDEHTECGCSCSPYTQQMCAGRLNQKTCKCECPDSEFGAERKRCESLTATYWDWDTCTCRNRKLETRGADYTHPGYTCQTGRSTTEILGMKITMALLGVCLVMSGVLATLAIYYRSQYRSASFSLFSTRN